MTENINHDVLAARRLLDGLAENPTADATTAAMVALTLATLALVEQQRIANLIALGQFRVGVNDLPHLRHLAIEPKDEFNVQPTAEIREALGL